MKKIMAFLLASALLISILPAQLTVFAEEEMKIEAEDYAAFI